MITGGKIISVEARKERDGPVMGMNTNVATDDVQINGDEVCVKYTFTMNYDPQIGSLKMSGEIISKEDSARIKDISKQWKDKKSLPVDYTEELLNAITYTCGINGVLVVRALGLPAPINPPRLRISAPGEAPAASGKGK